MRTYLRKSLGSPLATTRYPEQAEPAPDMVRGRPSLLLEQCNGDGACISACPADAISPDPWRVDLGKCIFCGACAASCPSQAIRLTQDFELAVRNRQDLLVGAQGRPIKESQTALVMAPERADGEARNTSACEEETGSDRVCGVVPAKRVPRVLPMSLIGPGGDLEMMGSHIKERLARLFKRSLHIRHLDSGSCNGCDWELTALLSPVHDLQRFGFDFVASPRHADLLLTTGTMTRNLTTAAIRTYRAMPEPRLVVAVGACGCSGGIFATTYAGGGGTDTVLPVDVYIPGCPPRPQALIYGLLLAVGRLEQKLGSRQDS